MVDQKARSARARVRGAAVCLFGRDLVVFAADSLCGEQQRGALHRDDRGGYAHGGRAELALDQIPHSVSPIKISTVGAVCAVFNVEGAEHFDFEPETGGLH